MVVSLGLLRAPHSFDVRVRRCGRRVGGVSVKGVRIIGCLGRCGDLWVVSVGRGLVGCAVVG